MKKHIAVLFGGMSTEHEVSCVSAACVIENIDKNKYEVIKIGITKDGVWFLFEGNTESIRSITWSKETENLRPAFISPCTVHHGIMVLDKLNKKYDIINIDAVFPVLHGKNGEDGTIQGLLQLSDIPFVGCDTYSSAVCMDKISTKLLCEQEHIKTVPFIAAKNSLDFDIDTFVLEVEDKLSYPVFVKPANTGSSVGITKAIDRKSLLKGIHIAFEYDRKILVEKAVKGKEIEVSVLGNEDPLISICGEIEPNSEFYDYNTKYVTNTAKYFIPARIDKNQSEYIQKTALKVFKTLDCKGLARVDFFACDDGSFYFNEINTIPGFTPISMYSRLIEKSGYSFTSFIEKLIELAFENKN